MIWSRHFSQQRHGSLSNFNRLLLLSNCSSDSGQEHQNIGLSNPVVYLLEQPHCTLEDFYSFLKGFLVLFIESNNN